jgi:hypothetical protein
MYATPLPLALEIAIHSSSSKLIQRLMKINRYDV